MQYVDLTDDAGNMNNFRSSPYSMKQEFSLESVNEQIDRWKQEEKLSLELAHQLLENDQIQEQSKRKRMPSQEGDTGHVDDELIAKLLQDELDEEVKEEKSKKKRVNVDDAMHIENRDAIEFVCQSVLRTNDDDRRSVMETLHCGEAELDRIIAYLIACRDGHNTTHILMYYTKNTIIQLFPFCFICIVPAKRCLLCRL
jgi:hypothetical protein